MAGQARHDKFLNHLQDFCNAKVQQIFGLKKDNILRYPLHLNFRVDFLDQAL